jgi:hypothetical protein
LGINYLYDSPRFPGETVTPTKIIAFGYEAQKRSLCPAVPIKHFNHKKKCLKPL